MPPVTDAFWQCAEFVASRDAGLIAAGVVMYALLGILLMAAAFYLVWLSVHRRDSCRAHFLKASEDMHEAEVRSETLTSTLTVGPARFQGLFGSFVGYCCQDIPFHTTLCASQMQSMR